VFSKTFLSLRSEELFPGSESEVVKSLSEFRVLVQRIISRRTEKDDSDFQRILFADWRKVIHEI